ncbi:hypothetical protein [Candidatus Oleimmundimicrobium sp.]|uniref:hypothetical protein n=1 Tax=Candidatus Oleimmundimicrobium sp. TaxID=3060597 RepID=UPI002724A9C7|nr:hypothetical protein [Candidatus Oleimmundimicrobium sp.]MDO8885323.1 hypothetical protein [Candidatus Oleimmundimicrobium sp.]
MADKDTQRNVRSSTKEAFLTPTQKHFHSLSEKGNVFFGKHQNQEKIVKKDILKKFKEREKGVKKSEKHEGKEET